MKTKYGNDYDENVILWQRAYTAPRHSRHILYGSLQRASGMIQFSAHSD